VYNTDNVNIIVNYIYKYWEYIDKRLTTDRPDLSSERAPPNDRTVTFKKKKRSLVKSPRLGSTPRHTGWLTVSCNVTLTLTDCIDGYKINVKLYSLFLTGLDYDIGCSWHIVTKLYSSIWDSFVKFDIFPQLACCRSFVFFISFYSFCSALLRVIFFLRSVCFPEVM
jgi:hypothetical protein